MALSGESYWWDLGVKVLINNSLNFILYLRKLYCNWANSNWRCPQTVVGASSEFSMVVEGSNGTCSTADTLLGVVGTFRGLSRDPPFSLLWWFNLEESLAGLFEVSPLWLLWLVTSELFELLDKVSDVDKPFTADNLERIAGNH